VTDIRTYNQNNNYSPAFLGEDGSIIGAHTTSNMKLERPKVNSADFNIALNNYSKYSHLESNKQLKEINKDIYQRTKKEKGKHEFNFKRYFTIFGILGLLTAAITCFRRGKG